MRRKEELSRRDALRLAGFSLGALAFRPLIKEKPSLPPIPENFPQNETEWPKLELETLPESVREILEIVPKTEIDNKGYLQLLNENGTSQGRVPFAQTQWNKEHRHPWDRLRTDLPWAIVLHWFSNELNSERPLQNYIYGFDGKRETLDGSEYSTSSQFLVGGEVAVANNNDPKEFLSIAQTQEPDTTDGIPFRATHLGPLDHNVVRKDKHYFLRAFNHLGHQLGFKGGIISVLQEMFYGVKIDPLLRTIGIEISGKFFDSPETAPDSQKIANVISVIWTLMKRYSENIPSALNIIGHNEIDLNKPDPGKKFMAEMRFLVGIKALIEDNEQMKELTFGRLLGEDGNRKEAVRKYFKFIRDFLVLVDTPKHVLEWEASTKYWQVYDKLFKNEQTPVADAFRMPVSGEIKYGERFLSPNNHEAVDIYVNKSEDVDTPIHLVANGECIFAEETPYCGPGKTIMFRHRLPDGSEVLSIYRHLSKVEENIEVGKTYEIDQQIGIIGDTDCHIDNYLHFAIAYGATWDIYFKHTPFVRTNVGPTWIKKHFLEPIKFINEHSQENTSSSLNDSLPFGFKRDLLPE